MRIEVKKGNQRITNKLLEDSNTINLSGHLSDNQLRIKREKRLLRMDFRKNWKEYLTLGTAVIFTLVMSIVYLQPVSANYAETGVKNDLFKFYGVDNHRDLQRAQRYEACENLQYAIIGTRDRKLSLECATRNTLQTAFESDYMQSRMCREQNNCIGMRGLVNGKYVFLTFDNIYANNIFYAKKYFTYHYKKSNFTLIYGFKQADGSYKYGWSGDSLEKKQEYLTFINDRYYKVYKEILEITN